MKSFKLSSIVVAAVMSAAAQSAATAFAQVTVGGAPKIGRAHV